MWFRKKKYSGPDSRMGGSDRRFPGSWATHIWGVILVLIFSSGVGVGINLRADTSSIERSITSVSEGDSIRSQVLLDSLISLSNRQIQRIEVPLVTQVVVRDTIYRVDTLSVTLPPQIVRVSDTIQVLIIDTVFAPPTIITIPPVQYGFFDSRHFVPNAGNIAYLIVGAALGSIVSSDASACILVSTTGTLERNCEPKQ